MERLLASLNGTRICFLFLGKNILEQLLELQALESYYVFSIFSFLFYFFLFRAKQEDTYTTVKRVAKEEIAGL